MSSNSDLGTGATGQSRPKTLAESIKQIEQQIALYGGGPHNDKQRAEIQKLTALLQKAREQANLGMANRIGQSTNLGIPATVSQVSHAGVLTSRSAPAVATSGGGGGGASAGGEHKVLDKRRIQELVKEVDPLEQLDDDVEEMLMQIADDFIDNVANAACQLAKHRKSSTVEVKDVQLHLDRNWNMWVPGFGSDELRPYKKAATTEAHKQRMALIKKTLKKY